MRLLKPKFWDQQYLTFQSLILYPFTFLLDLRNIITFFVKPKKYNQIRTICVGNIYLGGTGKTPLVDFLSKNLKKKFKTAIIKKEYRDHLDEKRLLGKNNKVFFNKSRKLSLVKAINEKFNLAIFDDGLQDKSIKYDLKIVCFNAVSLAGNKLRLPSGPLREKMSSLRKYDAVFINGNSFNKKFIRDIKRINPNIAIFRGEYVCSNLNRYKKNNYLVFSGIGNPQSLNNILKKSKIHFDENFIFPDHYSYSDSEIRKFKKIAKTKKLKLLTTEKDFYRLPLRLRKNIDYLKINLRVNKIKEFNKFIKKYL